MVSRSTSTSSSIKIRRKSSDHYVPPPPQPREPCSYSLRSRFKSPNNHRHPIMDNQSPLPSDQTVVEDGDAKETQKSLNFCRAADLPARDAKERLLKSSILSRRADLPAWYRDGMNPYILSGYRQATYSYRLCIDSLFYIHNETGNVYSHFFGSLLFVYLMVSLHLESVSSITTLTTGDHLVLSTFLFGCVICMGLSGGFHLFCCHSNEVSLKWNRVDYIGIVLILFGSLCPIVFYGFFCDAFYQKVYFAVISVFGLFTGYIVLTPRCHGPRFRVLRSLVFTLQGSFILLPYLHSSLLHGFEFTRQSLSFPWLVLMAITILSGTVVYNARIPEKWYPGRFDYWINSHQIFHIAVIGAAMLQYQGALSSALFWHSRNPTCSLSVEEMLSMK